MTHSIPRFAGRLNSFAVRPDLFWGPDHGKPTTLDLLQRMAQVPGLSSVDLNYPDHLENLSVTELRDALAANHLALNGFAMRYYTDPAFKLGAFTNPDPTVRDQATRMTCQAIDMLAEAGGSLLTLWLGQDGFDYAFQADYGRLWEQEIDGIRRVASYNPDIRISIEYKPSEPRAFSLLGDIGTTLLAIEETGLPNLGVTLDYCHVLFAGEQPAYSAMLAARHSRLLGLHLNDGYGYRDDGLMVGSVHFQQTLELLYYVRRLGYNGVLYFDTFPKHEDPVAECATNIAVVRGMLKLLERIGDAKLDDVLLHQNAVAGQQLIQRHLMPSIVQ
jgi:xylose isomerase